MGGAYSIRGAIVAAFLLKFLPALLNDWGVSPDWLTILFGIGVLQVLTTAPRGIVEQLPKDIARLGRLIGGLFRSTPPAEGAGGMIEVSGLTVRFGGVTPLDGMGVKFDAGTCGLIGPNGAGKTTFFNVLSGFVRPAAGTIDAFGENLLKMAHYRRARWGVRRTFQTEQAIEELSIYDNVAMVHEQSKMSKGSRREETAGGDRVRRRSRRPVREGGHAGRGRAPPGRGRAGGRRQARGWCCWTSRPPDCPTRRPSTSAR